MTLTNERKPTTANIKPASEKACKKSPVIHRTVGLFVAGVDWPLGSSLGGFAEKACSFLCFLADGLPCFFVNRTCRHKTALTQTFMRFLTSASLAFNSLVKSDVVGANPFKKMYLLIWILTLSEIRTHQKFCWAASHSKKLIIVPLGFHHS